MHELSVASDLLELVQAELKGQEVQVESIHLKLGVLAGVVKEALEFSFEVVTQGTELAGAKLLIEDVPLGIYCLNCKAEKVLEGVQSLRCPECGQLSGDIRQGKELELVTLAVRDLERQEVYG